MPVVSNTSPLSNLAIIDRLEILRGQLGQITIPPAVQLELDRLSHPAARARLAAALQEGWVRVIPLIAAVPSALAAALDPGEAEALALATQVQASLVLLDETKPPSLESRTRACWACCAAQSRRDKSNHSLPKFAIYVWMRAFLSALCWKRGSC